MGNPGPRAEQVILSKVDSTQLSFIVPNGPAGVKVCDVTARLRESIGNLRGAGVAGMQLQMSSLTSLRRVPSQQRGREKVARILDAAEELLIEHGYEYAVSTPTVLIER